MIRSGSGAGAGRDAGAGPFSAGSSGASYDAPARMTGGSAAGTSVSGGAEFATFWLNSGATFVAPERSSTSSASDASADTWVRLGVSTVSGATFVAPDSLISRLTVISLTP